MLEIFGQQDLAVCFEGGLDYEGVPNRERVLLGQMYGAQDHFSVDANHVQGSQVCVADSACAADSPRANLRVTDT